MLQVFFKCVADKCNGLDIFLSGFVTARSFSSFAVQLHLFMFSFVVLSAMHATQNYAFWQTLSTKAKPNRAKSKISNKRKKNRIPQNFPFSPSVSKKFERL